MNVEPGRNPAEPKEPVPDDHTRADSRHSDTAEAPDSSLHQPSAQSAATSPAESSPTAVPRRGTVLEVFLAFLRLGVTSFGGPIAHLGYFRAELVVRRKWVTERQYAELVALCQFLPGPASSQVGFALGLIRAGRLGAIAAWTAFTLPSAILLVAFAYGSISLEGDIANGVLVGLKAVAVAVVAHAVIGMARTLTPDFRRIIIAIVAILLSLFIPANFGQIAAILVGIIAGLALCRGTGDGTDSEGLPTTITRRFGVIALAAFGVLLVGLPILASIVTSFWTQAADAFYRAGALVFGGGHVVLPLLQAEPAISNSVSADQFLAGYGAAQAVPGPLFTFGAYLGFEMSPEPNVTLALVAAVLALIALFLPGLLLLTGVLPFWDRLRTNRSARAGIAGANAAVVGILAAAFINPIAIEGANRPWPLFIVLVCFLLLTRRNMPPWFVVVIGAALGALDGALGGPLGDMGWILQR